MQQYDEAVKALFSKHPSVQDAGFGAGAYKPGLEAMEKIDALLGHPWRRWRSIHVAGTNGKGTVCSMAAAALAADGTPTGLYTSPHLIDFRERMKVVRGSSFTTISEEEVLEFLDTFKEDIEPLSFFEITTAMAFWWFDRQKISFAVIEVGLGGRLDATNVITPEVSVVTSIGLDHCALLGDTRELIAGEKAGIFKRGVPAVVWGHDEATDQVFEARAKSVGCPLHYADETSAGIQTRASQDTHLCESPDAVLSKCDSPEAGHRVPNPEDNHLSADRLTATTALSLMKGFRLTPERLAALDDYKAITGLHARWEEINRAGKTFIFDIGHNSAALEGCFAKLMYRAAGHRPLIVYGVMADKDLDAIAPLFPAEADYLLCAPATQRALPVAKLYERLSELRPDLATEPATSVADAIKAALASEHDLIYVGGSTFVASEAIQVL